MVLKYSSLLVTLLLLSCVAQSSQIWKNQPTYNQNSSQLSTQDINLIESQINKAALNLLNNSSLKSGDQQKQNHNVAVTLESLENNGDNESREEYTASGECIKCPQGYYLLQAPTEPTRCLTCPVNAFCFGGERIGPQPGFWRSSNISINFLPCFNSGACLGSFNDTYIPEGTCASGYSGRLCSDCSAKYLRSSSFQCSECPPQWQNILLIVIVLLIIIVVLLIIIKITLKSMNHRKSPFSAYFKIITNHIHLIFLISTFDLEWPDAIQQFFDSTELASNVGDRIISLDCFLERTGKFSVISVYTHLPRPYIYLLIYLFLPFLLVLVSWAVWAIVYRHDKTTMCNRTIKTNIILLYVVHPAISTHFIRIFQQCTDLTLRCFNIDEEFRLVRDLSQVCWNSDHLAWAFAAALPGLIIWGLGIPLASLIILYCVRYKLDTHPIKEKYGFLYKGYKIRHYYWDAVIMFRKVAIILIAVTFAFLGSIVQALMLIILLVLYLFYTVIRRPFNTRRLNELEIVSLISSSITIYCGIFFISSRDSLDPNFTPNFDLTLTQESRWLLVIIIFLANFFFLLLWISYFFVDVRLLLAKKSTRLFAVCCLCCRLQKVKPRRLKYLKSEQNMDIINQIQILQGDLGKIKHMYFWDAKFKDKWVFEDLVRETQRKIDALDLQKFKIQDYSKLHTLEESVERAAKQEDDHQYYLKFMIREYNQDPNHKRNFASRNALKRLHTIKPNRRAVREGVDPDTGVRRDPSFAYMEQE